MSSQTDPEQTSGGLVGKVVGRVKEAVGAATGKEDLAREGRLQEAQSDAGIEARRSAEEASAREDLCARRIADGLTISISARSQGRHAEICQRSGFWWILRLPRAF